MTTTESTDSTTLTTPATAAERSPMSRSRKVALYGGVLYLVTFLTSIPALGLKGPARHSIDFVLGHGSSNSVVLACVLDMACALAGIGTAVALYPVTRRQSRSAALGFLATRTLEAAVMFVGAISLLALVTLRHDHNPADTASLVVVGRALVAIHEWTFLLGPSVMAGMNALFLASVMYRSRLVPRIIPTVGLIAAPLILASSVGTMFGGWGQTSSVGTALGFPVALWELSLGLWLTFKGFKPSPLTDDAPIEAGPLTFAAAA